MQGPGRCDHNKLEQTANLITSIPFLALGLQALRYADTHVVSAMPAQSPGTAALLLSLAGRRAPQRAGCMAPASLVSLLALVLSMVQMPDGGRSAESWTTGVR